MQALLPVGAQLCYNLLPLVLDQFGEVGEGRLDVCGRLLVDRPLLLEVSLILVSCLPEEALVLGDLLELEKHHGEVLVLEAREGPLLPAAPLSMPPCACSAHRDVVAFTHEFEFLSVIVAYLLSGTVHFGLQNLLGVRDLCYLM